MYLSDESRLILLTLLSLHQYIWMEPLAMSQNSTLTIISYLRNPLNKVIGIINFAKLFSKFYHQYYDLISKIQYWT